MPIERNNVKAESTELFGKASRAELNADAAWRATEIVSRIRRRADLALTNQQAMAAALETIIEDANEALSIFADSSASEARR